MSNAPYFVMEQPTLVHNTVLNAGAAILLELVHSLLQKPAVRLHVAEMLLKAAAEEEFFRFTSVKSTVQVRQLLALLQYSPPHPARLQVAQSCRRHLRCLPRLLSSRRQLRVRQL